MLPTGEFFMIKDLYRQGWSISEIARHTGYNRRTVSKYAKAKVPPVSKKRSAKPSKLDAFKDYIIQRLNSDPLTASRIYREIRDMGFTGKYTIVKDFIRKVRPPKSVLAVYRFETEPGRQAQADWAECGRIEIDGKVQKLYCFNMVLGYSRMTYAEFTLSIDTPTLIQCHLNAFDFFGGYPEEILYDNMKQIVIKRTMRSSDSEWNTQFEQFFMHYGFAPRLHRPYRPQTKGKIENTVGFVKRDFFMGSSFCSFSDINNQLRSWLNRVNRRIHGTTFEIPAERFKLENLTSLDGVPPYTIIREVTRIISRDSHISYNGNHYSVLYKYAGREARVQIEGNRIRILVGSEKVCEHEILTGSHRVSRNKEHFKGLLSEILLENKTRSNRSSPILKFSDPVVESRPLSVYEKFSEGCSHE
jgi:transposase